MNDVVLPAATDTTSRSCGTCGAEFLEQRTHVLRLDREQQRVGALGRLGVADRLDAVALAQQRRALGPANREEQVGGRSAGAQHAGQQRLAHLAGTEHCDCDQP